MISRVKGTQDFLDLTLFNFIVTQAKKHLATYHFTEISTPIIEPLDLFKRSLGEYTDVVSKEMFLIDTRGESHEKICLRPEATAPTIRAFIENGIQQTPWKVYSYGPMFRYERPQKGRFRQFNQISIEAIGSNSIFQDVQLIKMLDRFFHENLRLNNYALQINFLGCFDDRKAYRLVLKEFLESPQAQAAMCETCKIRKDINAMRIFDCKSVSCQQLYKEAPFIVDHLCDTCGFEWALLQEQLQLLSVSCTYNPTLVRGLDYYNKTVFEFTSQALGAQSTFCGGGRYDQLVSQLGGKHDQPSIGAGIGIERVMLLLEPFRDTLPLPQKPKLHIVVPMAEEQIPLALLFADMLQAADLCTDIILKIDSMKDMMRKVNKLGATYALILGEQEQTDNTVTIKNMVTGAQETVKQVEAMKYLQ
ncbi:MAG TPA: histidine--tRNA ligase [Candidatus Dependentiae bacterium]|nr:histidine--tRNA ligase [Candidatus Dependentiae bacterium]HRQ62924.1 histidine--tRNA ligase [Candidatus Dependentiae bacterium]